MAFPEGNKLFAGDFRVNLDGTNADMVQFTMYQSTCIFKAGLSSSCDGWEKCKEKVPDVSDPNQNVETICNSKLKFT